MSTIKTPDLHLSGLLKLLYCSLWTYFIPCSGVSIVNFDQVNAGWGIWPNLVIMALDQCSHGFFVSLNVSLDSFITFFQTDSNGHWRTSTKKE